MPTWTRVLEEINAKKISGFQAVDEVRRHYLGKLHEYTTRNVVAYYSGWLSRPPQTPNLSIGDEDKNGFMTAVHGLDRSLGLDLILHTPGGDIAATESIVDYLWTMFDKDVNVIVPQLAMSAGTMIACSAQKIIMGKESNLGPIDPQLGGVAAQAVLDEFQMAVESIKRDPATIPLWQAIIGKYHPTFLYECLQSIEWSRSMVKEWLKNNMFFNENEKNREKKSQNVLKEIADHSNTKTHSRHFSMKKCLEIDLNIVELEKDNELQDLVLTVHHAYMHTFSQSGAVKIIENHKGVATVLLGNAPQNPQMLGLNFSTSK
ncbi:MAG: hypothetical protein D084_Lepto4C00627G0006 [Leptospirillum sp. Group IV 'UBA BS']|nr:MAG: hypothetical protein D084_Lepto4C00627G0006 [Leptospirillum sp. Group IV 'UBA BS']